MSGITPLIAPFAISRLLVRARVLPPEQVTPDDLARVLPTLDEGLRVYLDEDEHRRAIEAIRALARS